MDYLDPLVDGGCMFSSVSMRAGLSLSVDMFTGCLGPGVSLLMVSNSSGSDNLLP